MHATCSPVATWDISEAVSPVVREVYNAVSRGGAGAAAENGMETFPVDGREGGPVTVGSGGRGKTAARICQRQMEVC